MKGMLLTRDKRMFEMHRFHPAASYMICTRLDDPPAQALEAGRAINGYLSKTAPALSMTAWFWFKAWLAFCLLTTPLTPALPFAPFMPSPTPFDYPFKIFHMK